MGNSNTSDELLKINEVANILKVGRETIVAWMEKGLIEYITLPRAKSETRDMHRIKASTVEDLLERGTTKRNASEQQNEPCSGRSTTREGE